MNARKTAPLVAALLLTAALDLAAQQAAPAPNRRWSASWTLGLALANSTADIEEALRGRPDRSMAGGLKLGRTITVGYAVKRHLEIRGMWASNDLGDAYAGWKCGGFFCDTNQRVFKKVTTLAVLPALRFGHGWRLGAGPSLNIVTLSDWDGHSSTATQPGLVGHVGVTTPVHSRLFFEIAGQYRYALPAEVEASGDVPETRVSVSHAILSLGVGVRL